MGCNKSSSKGEVYSNTILPQETKINIKINNLNLHLKQLIKEKQTKKLPKFVIVLERRRFCCITWWESEWKSLQQPVWSRPWGLPSASPHSPQILRWMCRPLHAPGPWWPHPPLHLVFSVPGPSMELPCSLTPCLCSNITLSKRLYWLPLPHHRSLSRKCVTFTISPTTTWYMLFYF